MRAFIRERRALLRIAPHLVRPLPFVIPTSRRHPVRNGAAMRIALLLNDLIASDRNDGLLPSHRLGGGRLLTHAQLGQIAPDLDPRTYTGGATWWDGQMLNSERLALAFVIGLEALGVGLGTAAFVAFIARSTHPAYTATQMALFTSLAAVPRTFINASAGWLVEMMGWTSFFWLCAALAIPGMLLLLKVAPWNLQDAEAKPVA